MQILTSQNQLLLNWGIGPVVFGADWPGNKDEKYSFWSRSQHVEYTRSLEQL